MLSSPILLSITCGFYPLGIRTPSPLLPSLWRCLPIFLRRFLESSITFLSCHVMSCLPHTDHIMWSGIAYMCPPNRPTSTIRCDVFYPTLSSLRHRRCSQQPNVSTITISPHVLNYELSTDIFMLLRYPTLLFETYLCTYARMEASTKYLISIIR